MNLGDKERLPKEIVSRKLKYKLPFDNKISKQKSANSIDSILKEEEEKKVRKRKSTWKISISKAEKRIQLENFPKEIQLILKQHEMNLSKVEKTKRTGGSNSNPPELIDKISSKKMLKKKIKSGLLNDIESNKPKLGEVEVINIEDSDLEDSDESLINYKVKLLCHKCSKGCDSEFEAYVHQREKHDGKFTNDMKDFSNFCMREKRVNCHKCSKDDDTEDVELYVDASDDKMQLET